MEREEIEQAVEALEDAEHDIRDQAGELLKHASLSDDHDEELKSLRQRLRALRYGLVDVVGPVEAQEILNLSESRIRVLAREGRIGVPMGNRYCFSRQELDDFSALDRPPGPPRKNEEKTP